MGKDISYKDKHVITMVDTIIEPPNLAEFMGHPIHYIYYVRDNVTREVKGIELVTDTGVKLTVYAKDADGQFRVISVEKEIG